MTDGPHAAENRFAMTGPDRSQGDDRARVPAQPAQPRAAKRPFGLYAIVVLLLTNAALIALDVSRSYVSLGLDLGVTLPGLDHARIDWLLRLLAAAGFVLVALGIWTLRRWAWVALMIVVGAALGEGLLRYARGEPRYLIMLFNVLIVFYLNQHSVQRVFRHGRKTPASA
jgi:hypothetical protein